MRWLVVVGAGKFIRRPLIHTPMCGSHLFFPWFVFAAKVFAYVGFGKQAGSHFFTGEEGGLVVVMF